MKYNYLSELSFKEVLLAVFLWLVIAYICFNLDVYNPKIPFVDPNLKHWLLDIFGDEIEKLS